MSNQPVAGESHFNGNGTRWMHKKGEDSARRVPLIKVEALLADGWEPDRIDPSQSKRMSFAVMSRRYQTTHPERYKRIRSESYARLMAEPTNGPRRSKHLSNKRNNSPVYVTKLKNETLTHYGPNQQLRCSWPECQVVDIDMPTLDHVNDDGNIERRGSRYQGGCGTYQQLRTKGFPLGYQTLCANHQLKKELLRRRECRRA